MFCDVEFCEADTATYIPKQQLKTSKVETKYTRHVGIFIIWKHLRLLDHPTVVQNIAKPPAQTVSVPAQFTHV